MAAIAFYRDENGAARAHGTDTALTVFLESDCQSAISIIDELLAALMSGEDRQFVGNAHELIIADTRATITSLHNDTQPERRLSRQYLTETLQEWRAFVSAL